MLNDNKETKICKKCGRELPLDRFRFSSANGHPYYRGLCKDCEGVYFKEHSKKKREKEFTFSDNVEIRIGREFKEINPARILNIADLGIIPCGTDEVFVRLMDYKDTWLSNYGRCITRTWGKYGLLDGSYIRGELRYSLRKNVFYDGEWIYKRDYAYAPKMVVETFIVNEDKANNIYVWHSGNDKEDCYYKNLYPLNQEQFRIVRNHFLKTGDDSEEFILKVMNDIRYKPDDWSAKTAEPVMYGVGYHGTLYTNSDEDSYDRWHWMMNRCYSTAIHKLYPQYENCTVCKEWLNYSNYKLWYDEHKIEMKVFWGRVSIDKDILIKGNTVYSPETVCIVPQTINTLFVTCKEKRGDLPLGVFWDVDKNKYRACVAAMGKSIKLGTFNTVEEAFDKYKITKEKLIKDVAEKYKDMIPSKTYEAMMNWKIEIID